MYVSHPSRKAADGSKALERSQYILERRKQTLQLVYELILYQLIGQRYFVQLAILGFVSRSNPALPKLGKFCFVGTARAVVTPARHRDRKVLLSIFL